MKFYGLNFLLCCAYYSEIFSSEPISLEPLIILTTRSEKNSMDTPGSDVVITSKEIGLQGSNSLGSSLKYVPGVSVPFDFTGADPLVPYLSSGEKSINIRGIEGNRISISVDGIRQPQEFFVAGGMAGSGRVFFDPATLNQLELFKSASSSLYGNENMGGAVNGRTVSPESILGKKIQGNAASNELTYNTVNRSYSNRLTGGLGNGTWASSIVFNYREGHERINNSSDPSDPMQFDSHALVFKTLHKGKLFDIEGTIDLFDFSNFTDVNSIEGTDPTEDVASYVGHEGKRERQRLSLEVKLSENESIGIADKMSIFLYKQESINSSVNSQNRLDHIANRERKINFQTDLTGLSVQLNKVIEFYDISHDISTGLDFSLSDISTSYLQKDIFKDPQSNDSFSNKNSMAPSEAQEKGFYLRDEIELESFSDWVFSPSVRFDSYEVTPSHDQAFIDNPSRKKFRFNPVHYKNEWVISPGLSILKRMGQNANIYLTYNKGIRNPSAEELNGFFEHPPTGDRPVIIRPNPSLQEEKSDSFEFGTQSKTGKNSTSFAYFLNSYDDFISLEEQADPNLDVFSNQNVGNVRIYGFELALERDVRDLIDTLNGVSTGISTAWSKGMKLDDDLPLNTIEPWKTIFFVEYDEKEKWGFRMTATYRAAKRLKDLDSTSGDVPIGDSFVLDLVNWFRLNEVFQLRIGINNLTNEDYFLWSSARRGGGHVSTSTEARNMQPGTNGFLSLLASF